jgi:hypothetical protein
MRGAIRGWAGRNKNTRCEEVHDEGAADGMRETPGRSIHDVRPEAFNYVWNARPGDVLADEFPEPWLRLSREEAYALRSGAVDLRIHEVVDAPNRVVGAFLPDDIFGGG